MNKEHKKARRVKLNKTGRGGGGGVEWGRGEQNKIKTKNISDRNVLLLLRKEKIAETIRGNLGN